MMRSAKLAACLVVAAFLCLPAAALAQEGPEAQKLENVTWYEIVQVDYRPGKMEAALDVVREHYVPAAGQAGNPGPELVLQHQTGDWDLTIVWRMDRGPSALEWETSPEGAAVQRALLEQVGQERMREIGEEYESYVARANVTIAYQDPSLLVQE